MVIFIIVVSPGAPDKNCYAKIRFPVEPWRNYLFGICFLRPAEKFCNSLQMKVAHEKMPSDSPPTVCFVPLFLKGLKYFSPVAMVLVLLELSVFLGNNLLLVVLIAVITI